MLSDMFCHWKFVLLTAFVLMIPTLQQYSGSFSSLGLNVAPRSPVRAQILPSEPSSRRFNPPPKPRNAMGKSLRNYRENPRKNNQQQSEAFVDHSIVNNLHSTLHSMQPTQRAILASLLGSLILLVNFMTSHKAGQTMEMIKDSLNQLSKFISEAQQSLKKLIFKKKDEVSEDLEFNSEVNKSEAIRKLEDNDEEQDDFEGVLN